MGGTGCIVFYVMIDALNFWNGSPFRYPGEYTVEFVYTNTPIHATVMSTVCRHSFVVLSVLHVHVGTTTYLPMYMYM